jgi:hypothetical protein
VVVEPNRMAARKQLWHCSPHGEHGRIYDAMRSSVVEGPRVEIEVERLDAFSIVSKASRQVRQKFF